MLFARRVIALLASLATINASAAVPVRLTAQFLNEHAITPKLAEHWSRTNDWNESIRELSRGDARLSTFLIQSNVLFMAARAGYSSPGDVLELAKLQEQITYRVLELGKEERNRRKIRFGKAAFDARMRMIGLAVIEYMHLFPRTAARSDSEAALERARSMLADAYSELRLPIPTHAIENLKTAPILEHTAIQSPPEPVRLAPPPTPAPAPTPAPIIAAAPAAVLQKIPEIPLSQVQHAATTIRPILGKYFGPDSGPETHWPTVDSITHALTYWMTSNVTQGNVAKYFGLSPTTISLAGKALLELLDDESFALRFRQPLAEIEAAGLKQLRRTTIQERKPAQIPAAVEPVSGIDPAKTRWEITSKPRVDSIISSEHLNQVPVASAPAAEKTTGPAPTEKLDGPVLLHRIGITLSAIRPLIEKNFTSKAAQRQNWPKAVDIERAMVYWMTVDVTMADIAHDVDRPEDAIIAACDSVARTLRNNAFFKTRFDAVVEKLGEKGLTLLRDPALNIIPEKVAQAGPETEMRAIAAAANATMSQESNREKPPTYDDSVPAPDDGGDDGAFDPDAAGVPAIVSPRRGRARQAARRVEPLAAPNFDVAEPKIDIAPIREGQRDGFVRAARAAVENEFRLGPATQERRSELAAFSLQPHIAKAQLVFILLLRAAKIFSAAEINLIQPGYGSDQSRYLQLLNQLHTTDIQIRLGRILADIKSSPLG